MSLTATRTEQDPAEGRIPGNKGIWAGILSEMTEFALLFGVYFIARAHFPEAFRDGPLRLSLFAGTFNTLLMISGSYFVANAVIAIRQNRPEVSIRWLVLVLFAACGTLRLLGEAGKVFPTALRWTCRSWRKKSFRPMSATTKQFIGQA